MPLYSFIVVYRLIHLVRNDSLDKGAYKAQIIAMRCRSIQLKSFTSPFLQNLARMILALVLISSKIDEQEDVSVDKCHCITSQLVGDFQVVYPTHASKERNYSQWTVHRCHWEVYLS